MRKLSLIAVTCLVAGINMVGCSDGEENGADGGTGATSSKGGSSGKGGASSSDGGADDTGSGGDESGASGGASTNPTGGTGGTNTPPPGKNACGEDADGPVDIDADEDGNITIDHLTADTIWTLNGRLFVQPGETLTIDPCTLIEATGKPSAGSLFVPQGAQIHAVGTADEPIVFTTQTHEFEGDAPWGGIVLIGNATVARHGVVEDVPSYLRTYEGYDDVRTTFGLEDPADFDDEDSSGAMSYVRIEYGGDIIVADKEINGMSFCGVGSGTQIDHIMVKDQQDDCFEFFGGTVNADHLICQNSGDDMFDTDLGFKGHLQYLFGRNLFEGTSGDPNGFEWDGDQDDLLTTPNEEDSMPIVSNVTLCGLNAAGTAASYGAIIRRQIGEGTSIMNALITGFDYGVDLRNPVGTNEEPFVTWTNSYFFGQLEADTENPDDVNDDDSGTIDDPKKQVADFGFDEDAWLTDGEGNVIGEAPDGFDCYSEVPTAPSDELGGGTPESPLDDSGDYVGAGDFSDEGWDSGAWINWSAE